MQDCHKLEIWNRSMAFAADVYRFAARLPETERYGLSAQLRRAASAVPLNITEGAASATAREFAQLLGYAYRSVKEVVTCLELSERLFPELPVDATRQLIDEGEQIARMTHTMIARVRAAAYPTTRKP